jgi:hypothetical protein
MMGFFVSSSLESNDVNKVSDFFNNSIEFSFLGAYSKGKAETSVSKYT